MSDEVGLGVDLEEAGVCCRGRGDLSSWLDLDIRSIFSTQDAEDFAAHKWYINLTIFIP